MKTAKKEDVLKELRSMSDDHGAMSDILNGIEQLMYMIGPKLTKSQKELIEQFLDYVNKGLLKHFAVEEKDFFPMLEHLEFADSELAHIMVEQLIAEHELIRGVTQRTTKLYKKVSSGEMSLDWFVANLMSLVDFIRVHARKENSVVYLLCKGLEKESTCEEICRAYVKVHTPPREYV